MKKLLIISIIFFFCSQVFAIIPAAKGVKTPQYVIDFHKKIQSEYAVGYWAERFKEREILRQKVSKGILPSSVLIRDTTFALTLLGRYSDTSPKYSRQQFQAQLFDGPNPTGTITQYYTEISYDQLYFTGTCTNWYTAPGTQKSYVGSNSGLSPSGGPRFVLDIIIAADSTFDFSKHIQYYDNNGNPRIGFVAAVHTGADAAAGAVNIWSHRWNFRMHTNNQPYQTNDTDPVSGKKVLIDGDYAIQPELRGSDNLMGEIVDIGVFTHEFGHIFGLPDLYDTDNSSEGLGNWCLMAGGSWGGNGNTPHTPVHLSAWGKMKLGWVTPIDITSFNQNVVVKNAEEQPELFRIWRAGPITNEYILVENRQKIGFDKYLYIGGLLIFHVDDNQPNNRDENHYKVGLIQADGKWDLNQNRNRGDDGDPYPGSSRNTRFDQVSNPNSSDYAGLKTYVSVRNIRQSNKNMIADFDIGTMPYVLIKSTSLSENSVIKNGRIEQGEFADVNVVLQNIELVNSPYTTFKIWCDDPNIEFSFSQFTTTISGETIRSFTMLNALNVKQEFISRAIYFKTEADGGGSKYLDSFKVVIGIPKILLVSRSDKAVHGIYYQTSLKNSNKFFEYVENESPAYYYGRDIIIWLSGKNKDSVFTNIELDSLTSHLNNGKKLFLSGQNIAEFLSKYDSLFLQNQLGINYIKNASLFTNKVYGIASDQFGKDISLLRINGSEGANNETSMDIIEARSGFNISVTYKANGQDAAGGWKTYPNNGKLFFLGFGFESINNDESTIKRDKLMQNILSWFDPSISVDDNNLFTELNCKLDQNYPNPFNPSTRISYELRVSSFVLLKIYDVLGREVTTLVNELKSAGRHTVEWNPDKSGQVLPSGVYFYEIRAVDPSTNKSFSDVKKMMVVK